ncbi:MAG: 6-hydroxymethylpterin diphosphokinase MptE-like protein [Candidatus Methanomethylophilaceae archaeon]
MRFSDWEPLYLEILGDFGFDRSGDEMSVRILKMVTVNSDLIDDDEFSESFSREVTVFGNAPCLESDIGSKGCSGTLVASGSSVGRLISMGIMPDIVVTDLDGDIGPQIEASSHGAVTAIHAHGDNGDLVRTYAGLFKGKVILTTQSTPENTVYDFGGFTDGDRAVCMAVHFGADKVHLRGFDYSDPMPKDGSDPEVKLRKLAWAERIIGLVCTPDMTDR